MICVRSHENQRLSGCLPLEMIVGRLLPFLGWSLFLGAWLYLASYMLSQPLPPSHGTAARSPIKLSWVHKKSTKSGWNLPSFSKHTHTHIYTTSNPAIKKKTTHLNVEGILLRNFQFMFLLYIFVLFSPFGFHPACGFGGCMLSILRVQPQRCHQCQVHDWHQCRSTHPGSTAHRVWCFPKLGSGTSSTFWDVGEDELAVNFKCKIA